MVPLDEALGCVLAGPEVAPEPVPPFANSAMDGYAVKAEDVASAVLFVALLPVHVSIPELIIKPTVHPYW